MNASAINNLRDVSFGQLVKGIGSLKIGVLWSITAGFCAYSALIFGVGQVLQTSLTAIQLARPFEMAIEANDIKLKLDSVELIQAPDELQQKDQVIYEIHQIDMVDSLSIKTIGHVVADKPGRRVLGLFGDIALMGNALAQGAFDWYDHEGNFKFREEYLDKDTIRRYYDDGWVLEYKVDAQRHSIPSTFKWITR